MRSLCCLWAQAGKQILSLFAVKQILSLFAVDALSLLLVGGSCVSLLIQAVGSPDRLQPPYCKAEFTMSMIPPVCLDLSIDDADLDSTGAVVGNIREFPTKPLC